MAAGRPLFAFLSLILTAGAILLIFLTFLAGISNHSPLNKVYFLQADTGGIPNAPQASRWTFWNVCPLSNGDSGNNNCGDVHPAFPLDPPRGNNFGTTQNVPSQFIGTHQYFYLTRFMFAFVLIGLFFAVVSLFTGLLALCTRIGSYISGFVGLIGLFFQTLTAALMTYVSRHTCPLHFTGILCIMLPASEKHDHPAQFYEAQREDNTLTDHHVDAGPDLEKQIQPPVDTTNTTAAKLVHAPNPFRGSPHRPHHHEQPRPEQSPTQSTFQSLSYLDRFLALWILLAMVVGILLGNFVPRTGTALRQGEFIGLGLAWAFLPDESALREGLILVGIARCIAMVLIWNRLAGGDGEYCAILVAVNSVLQMVLYAPLALLFVKVIGRSRDQVNVQYDLVAKSVGVFLGIPLAAAILTRGVLRTMAGKEWYEKWFLRVIGPLSLIGLLFTILVLFASQGQRVVHQIVSVVRVAAPLVVYFGTIFSATLFAMTKTGFGYELACTQSFTAASNNFELAIAVAVATFGAESDQALAATVGPLIEVPVLLGLVYVARMVGSSKWGRR
ncbi:MAG: hypothetical protein Q9160_005751 [Pyrenula sp. 1 TL-2023]